jgi:glycosyltransferase involved in cell wall biosynthesis
LAITELHVGGAENCLCNLAIRLDRTRFDPTVFSLAPRPASGQDQLVQQLQDAGIDVRFVGVRSARRLWHAVRCLRQMVADVSPDILQTFLFHANVVGALSVRQTPTVRLVLGIRVADPRRRRAYAERLAARRAERVVCVSRSVAEFARTKIRIPPHKLVEIPNGVDLTALPAQDATRLSEFGVPSDAKVIAVVGRLDRQKGTDWLLAAAPELLHACPQVHLLLVGDGPERAALERQVAGEKLQNRIHFAGWRADVPQILNSCVALALLSRWEGMPNAVLEAMACRLPVVATRAEGVEQLLGEQAAEQLVPFGDTAALVATVSQLLANPMRADRLAQQNRVRVEQHFSFTAMVSAYQDLYGSLVSGGNC